MLEGRSALVAAEEEQEERLVLACFLPAASLAAVFRPFPYLEAVEEIAEPAERSALPAEVLEAQTVKLALAHHYFAELRHQQERCQTAHHRAFPDALLNP